MISLNSLLTTGWESLHPEEEGGPMANPHPIGVAGIIPSPAASFSGHLLSVCFLEAPGM